MLQGLIFKMRYCNTCGRPIKILESMNKYQPYTVSCGNLDCMNIQFAETTKEAIECAKELGYIK